MVSIIALKFFFVFFLLRLPGCFRFCIVFLRCLHFLDSAQFLASIRLWVMVIILASSLGERCFRGLPLILLILSILCGETGEDLYLSRDLSILRRGDEAPADVFKISFIWARVRVGTLLPWRRCDIYRSNEIIVKCEDVRQSSLHTCL